MSRSARRSNDAYSIWGTEQIVSKMPMPKSAVQYGIQENRRRWIGTARNTRGLPITKCGASAMPRESCRIGASEREHPIAELIQVFQSVHPIGRHQFRTCLATRLFRTEAWVEGGFTPNLRPLLVVREINGHQGDWVLVEGHIHGTDEHHDREIFAFLRGVFLARKEVGSLREKFLAVGYPDNRKIPKGDTEYLSLRGGGGTSSELCAAPLLAEREVHSTNR